MLAMYLAVLDDRSSEEQFIDVYNTYKRLVYHTAYKIMGDSYLAEEMCIRDSGNTAACTFKGGKSLIVCGFPASFLVGGNKTLTRLQNALQGISGAVSYTHLSPMSVHPSG